MQALTDTAGACHDLLNNRTNFSVSQWKIAHYVDTQGKGKYYKIDKKSLTDQLESFHYGRKGNNHREMISSAGTCSGDSGGPLFQVRYAQLSLAALLCSKPVLTSGNP